MSLEPHSNSITTKLSNAHSPNCAGGERAKEWSTIDDDDDWATIFNCDLKWPVVEAVATQEASPYHWWTGLWSDLHPPRNGGSNGQTDPEIQPFVGNCKPSYRTAFPTGFLEHITYQSSPTILQIERTYKVQLIAYYDPGNKLSLPICQ